MSRSKSPTNLKKQKNAVNAISENTIMCIPKLCIVDVKARSLNPGNIMLRLVEHAGGCDNLYKLR